MLNLMSRERNILALVMLVLLCTVRLPSYGQQSSAVTSVAPASLNPTVSADDRYRIGPGDVLDVRIYNRPNLSREAVRVEGNGMIRMPLIDTEIQAACHTEG